MPKKVQSLKNNKTTPPPLDDAQSYDKAHDTDHTATTETSVPHNQTKPTLKTPPIQFKQSQSLLQQIEQKLGCPLLVYYKSPSSNIWLEDLYAIQQCLQRIGTQKKLALFMRSDGGSGMISLRIVHLLRSYADNLILLAPSECASAATMIALGCDEIHMGPVSSLSPVDSSLTHALSPLDHQKNKVPVSLDELWRVVRLWNEADGKTYTQSEIQDESEGIHKKLEENGENPYKYLYNYIHPLVFGAVDRYSSLSVRICHDILSYHEKDEEKIARITHTLNHDYPAHSYPITIREAQRIGLPVKPMNSEIVHLLDELSRIYGEITDDYITDYNETSFHNNSVLSIIEMPHQQVRYQYNYDKIYFEAQKRFVSLHDESGWCIYTQDKNGRVKTKKVHYK